MLSTHAVRLVSEHPLAFGLAALGIIGIASMVHQGSKQLARAGNLLSNASTAQLDRARRTRSA